VRPGEFLEVEVKLRVGPEALEKLKGLAKYLGEKVEEDLYFNFDCEGGCCRDFAKTDEAIRVRRSDKCYLTYKGPKVGKEVKAREEIEFEVGDCEKVKKFLEKLCLKPVITVKKRRKLFKYGNLTITFDEVEGLGTFVEIEGFGEEAKEEVLRAWKELFPEAEKVDKTYLEMILELTGRKNGI